MVGRIARADESGSDCVYGNTIYKYRFACVQFCCLIEATKR